MKLPSTPFLFAAEISVFIGSAIILRLISGLYSNPADLQFFSNTMIAAWVLLAVTIFVIQPLRQEFSFRKAATYTGLTLVFLFLYFTTPTVQTN